MTNRSGVLITADELIRRMADGEPVTILDVRWELATPDGRAAYLHEHLPGAVYVSLEDELSDHSVTGRGRHPLPSGADLQAAARRWGVRDRRPVVVYDDWNRAGSARAWWVLRAAGLPDVRILDGGLAAWTASGGPLDSGPVDPQPGTVTVPYDDLYAGAMSTLTADQANDGPLVDARAPERFRGELEPVDPAAGHIPGARNLPSTSVLTGEGRFRPDGELADLLAGRGIGDEPVGVYCGSGVTAAVTIAALTALGRGAALFPGSWSQWSSEPGRPVARGAE
ncbi:sulfurtransferase [Candidatus Mycolicibacterium alkanivorans]|uniref:Sulfurtransferase n=1 Tax=Candidatus Mycolicibacterium alkanivorans TaxID=2954114 RepID=A0ABS9YXJ2_9MYCO|nr:sulfurtransferase [Candidatus Mycolicibacterium alkanivorans]MCI4675966.1 sulfurtransferase [Candidatus Mycolicibacterium alkanivorans]